MIVESLAAVLGFKIEGKENLDKFKRGLDGADKSVDGFASNVSRAAKGITVGLAAVTTAAAAVAGGMFKLASDAAGPLDALSKSADRAGVSFEAMQELGFAHQQAGGSTQEMASNLEMLSARLAEAARGQGRAKTALEAYGLSATDAAGNIKTADNFLMELSDKFQDLSQAQALDLAQKLGLSRATITMLRDGRDELEKVRKQARDAGLVFTQEDADRAREYNDAMNLLTQSFGAIKTAIGMDLIPSLMEGVGAVQKWVNENRGMIRQNVGGFFRRMGDHAKFLREKFEELSPSARNLGLALLPLLRVIAPRATIIGALAIATDDFLTYLRGGESQIGAFIMWLQQLTGVSEGTAQTIATIGGAIIALGLLKPALIFAPLLAGIRALGPALATALGYAFGYLATPAGIKLVLGGVAVAIVAGFREQIVDELKGIWKNLGNMVPGGPSRAPLFAPGASGPRPQDNGAIGPRSDSGAAPLSAEAPATFAERFSGMPGSKVNSDNTSNVSIDMTVNATSTDGPGIAGEIQSALEAGLRERGLSIHGESPVTP